jgi:MarR family transcriptional regulator, 2-MHQ and catechol-resistance regulon repressor
LGTHYKGRPAEVRALDAFIKLMRAASSVQSGLDRLLEDLGLTENQFGVLEVLLHLGSLHQRLLGQKLLTSGGNITMVVDNLEKRGLVRRERQESDRRLVVVHLTRSGRALIERIFPAHVAAIEKAMSPLGAAEQEDLGRLCKKLGLGQRRD